MLAAIFFRVAAPTDAAAYRHNDHSGGRGIPIKTRAITKLFLHALLCVGVVTAHYAHAQPPAVKELSLNGLAIHAHLRNEVYMAALYTEIGSGNEQMLLESDQNKRMELRVLARRWSARGFADHWNQALLINNGEQELANFVREVRQFTSAIRGKLIPGDKITIDYRVKQHTQLTVDGVPLLTVRKDPLQFFQLLLRCWIGPRPPSTEFKNNILNLPTGEDAAGLLARYEALIPVSGRNKTITAWRRGNSQAAALAAITAAAPAAKTKPQLPGSRVGQAPAASVPKTEASQLSPTPSKAKQESSTAAALQAPQTASAASESLAAAKQPATAPDQAADDASRGPEPSGASPQAALATSTEKTNTSTPVEQSAALQSTKTTTQQDLENGLLNLYRSNLLKRVYGFVIYPERAIDRNQEGTVVLQVTVNRRGKVLSIKNDEPSRYRLLNSAATRAIKKASPFPAAPRKLKGSTFDLEFPIVFRIPRS